MQLFASEEYFVKEPNGLRLFVEVENKNSKESIPYQAKFSVLEKFYDKAEQVQYLKIQYEGREFFLKNEYSNFLIFGVISTKYLYSVLPMKIYEKPFFDSKIIRELKPFEIIEPTVSESNFCGQWSATSEGYIYSDEAICSDDNKEIFAKAKLKFQNSKFELIKLKNKKLISFTFDKNFKLQRSAVKAKNKILKISDQIKFKGKIFYGGSNDIEKENEFWIQDISGQVDSWKAFSERSLRESKYKKDETVKLILKDQIKNGINFNSLKVKKFQNRNKKDEFEYFFITYESRCLIAYCGDPHPESESIFAIIKNNKIWFSRRVDGNKIIMKDLDKDGFPEIILNDVDSRTGQVSLFLSIRKNGKVIRAYLDEFDMTLKNGHLRGYIEDGEKSKTLGNNYKFVSGKLYKKNKQVWYEIALQEKFLRKKGEID